MIIKVPSKTGHRMKCLLNPGNVNAKLSFTKVVQQATQSLIPGNGVTKSLLKKVIQPHGCEPQLIVECSIPLKQSIRSYCR